MSESLSGKPVAEKIYKRLSELIEHNLERKGRPPHLVILYSVDNEESRIYVGQKARMCENLGIKCTLIVLDSSDTFDGIKRKIVEQSRRFDVDGIILQLPLHLNLPYWKTQELIDSIHPDKDVDGLTTSSAGYLYKNKRILWRIPATAKAVTEIIQHYNIETKGRQVVILGRSELVGKPLAHILSSPEYNATVSVCHSKTQWNHRVRLMNQAHILISAIGKPEFVKSHHNYVIDVGIAKTKEGIKGDVKWGCGRCQTPVPGGVGPVTVACLLENVVLRWSYTDERI